MPLVITGAQDLTRARLTRHEALILRLARAESVALSDTPPDRSVQIVADEAIVCLPLAGVIDVDAEAARLAKESKKLESEIARIDKKLDNQGFLAKAPEDIVAAERDKRDELAARMARVGEAQSRIADLSNA